jgi:hypothetical protein
VPAGNFRPDTPMAVEISKTIHGLPLARRFLIPWQADPVRKAQLSVFIAANRDCIRPDSG